MLKKYLLRDRARVLSKRSPLLMAIRVTEKSSMLYGQQVLTFEVHDLKAGKIGIAKAVEDQLKVKPVSVNTVLRKGKNKRVKGKTGRRSDRKFAYVRLPADFQMPELAS